MPVNPPISGFRIIWDRINPPQTIGIRRLHDRSFSARCARCRKRVFGRDGTMAHACRPCHPLGCRRRMRGAARMQSAQTLRDGVRGQASRKTGRGASLFRCAHGIVRSRPAGRPGQDMGKRAWGRGEFFWRTIGWPRHWACERNRSDSAPERRAVHENRRTERCRGSAKTFGQGHGKSARMVAFDWPNRGDRSRPDAME